MALTQKGLDFLFENRMKDSREWFAEHRDTYIDLVKLPMLEITAKLSPAMLQIDNEIVTDPKRLLSRLNRDVRFSKDKSLYRDTVWCTFVRDKHKYQNMPAFFFEFSPIGYRYGCGYYYTDAKLMEILRSMVIGDVSEYKQAQKALDKQSLFLMQGDSYKRNKYVEYPAKKQEWLNQKELYFAANCNDITKLFSEELVDTIAEGFRDLAPVYRFLCKVSERAQSEY